MYKECHTENTVENWRSSATLETIYHPEYRTNSHEPERASFSLRICNDYITTTAIKYAI